MAADKNNHLIELKFNYNAVDFERYEKDVYSSNGWFGRKITAIPAIAILGVVKTVIRLVKVIFLDFPRVLFGNVKPLQITAYTLARDYQGLFGRFLTLFNDKKGQYLLFQSHIHNKLYASARSPQTINRLAGSNYACTEPSVEETRKAILANIIDVNGKIGQRGVTPLMLAVEHGYEDIVMDFLDRGAEINEDVDGKKALSIAIKAKRPQLALKLIDRGADVNKAGKTPFTPQKQKPLIAAVGFGFKEVVEKMLAMGVKVNEKTQYQNTALTRAIRGNHTEIAILLLEKGADPNTKEGYNKNTPLMEAAIKGNKDVCDLLLKKGANTNAMNEDGSTALSYALSNGHQEIAMQLIDSGADVKVQLSKHNTDTLLISAALQGFKDVVEKLLDKGVKINKKDFYGYSALYHAVKERHTEIAMLLIDRGADFTHKTQISRDTLLMLAARCGDMEIVKKLVAKGVKLDQKNCDKVTALSKAIKEGHIEIAEFLIDQGANLNSEDTNGKTPLMEAVIQGQKEVVWKIIDKGAHLNISDKKGNSAVVHALADGHDEIAMELIKKGADLQYHGKYGKHTNFIYASWKGCKQVVSFMMQEGVADPVTPVNNGSNALHFAAQGGHLDIVKFFFINRQGLDVNSRGCKKRTALHFAAAAGKANVVDYLLEKGANPKIADEDGKTPLVIVLKKEKL